MAKPSTPSDRQAFYAAILNDWDDDTPRLVFADWLDERDDPVGHLRAEMIRVGVEVRARSTGRKLPSVRLSSRLQKAESAFRAALMPWRVYLDEARFERGFIDDWIVRRASAASYLGEPEAVHEELGPVNFPPIYFHASPILGAPSSDYVRLAEQPSLRFWHAIPVYSGDGQSGQLGDDNFAALLQSPHLSGLRRLTAVDHARGPDPEQLAPLGVRAMHALAGNPALANLTHLTLWWNGLGDDAIRVLAESAHLRNLKELSLADHFTDKAVRALADSPILESVEALHLYGPLTGSALRVLLRSPRSCLFSTPEIGLIIWLGSSFNDQSFGSPRSVKVRTLFVTVPALACYDLHAPQEAFPSNR